MARTELEKAQALDTSVLLAASRLRLRALALIEGALSLKGVQRATLAKRLGVRRTSVQHALGGNGNLTLQTLAEYLGALDIEVELVPVPKGEVAQSMRERRAPQICALTMREHDWSSGVLAVGESRQKRVPVWGVSTPDVIDSPRQEVAGARGATVTVGRPS